MTEASSKVKWCLNKAKKELEDKQEHRGLVEVTPSDDMARKHLGKAQHNLNAAKFFYSNGYSDWSASAFFYCMYHCFLAIIRKHGYESRNQECTLSAVEALKEEGIIDVDLRYLDMLKITKAKEVDHSLIKIREDFQYGVNVDYVNQKGFDLLTSVCEDVIEKATELIG
jgi:uncharacterized protein (UPF0332 family)